MDRPEQPICPNPATCREAVPWTNLLCPSVTKRRCGKPLPCKRHGAVVTGPTETQETLSALADAFWGGMAGLA